FRTFSKRFKDYPVIVEMVSRLRDQKTTREVLQRVREGKVDVLIGTHRLLSADVSFKDLGVVVVDEEQRFGVKHKEQLKKLRKLVDVLTMTATPIPRTLHMAMMGVRDLSIISTPPVDRRSIRTFVSKFDREVIKEDIESGLHIPSANTILVDRADTFGLSQLYQIRGRIGRSRERAYAYLLVPARRPITREAQKRLQVLQQFTELGAGFQIASYDLELR